MAETEPSTVGLKRVPISAVLVLEARTTSAGASSPQIVTAGMEGDEVAALMAITVRVDTITVEASRMARAENIRVLVPRTEVSSLFMGVLG
jgi:hypothetical protein